MKITGIIPARIASTRLPEKPLKKLGDKTIVEWVYLNSSKSQLLNELVVATDSEIICEHVKSFGGKAILTSDKHTNGTERVGEAAQILKCDVAVNIQGDEPFMRADMIDKAVEPFLNGFKGISTLKTKIVKEDDLKNPAICKVITDSENNAIYFSRLPIPYVRDNDIKPVYYKHIGLYAYDVETLDKMVKMPEVEIETAEKLEQLRALYNGIKIRLGETDYRGVEINTPEDLIIAAKLLDFLKNQA
ncbi:MAG: 3-deoxy-manno-octulosonate cytidylyltransferase [Candidatus Muiribacteriota bacterium]